ncbi:MAG: GntR family transcriptional regulator [Candidatus Humimicrobiaceae bacterium]
MKTIKEQVYDEIKNLILLGKISPGERVSYNKLVTNLNVSLIPLREAMNLLEADGLIEIKSRKGVFVKDLKESEVDEIYFLRSILEPIVLREAILNINEDQIKKLKNLNIEIEKSKEDSNLHLLFMQNKDFHIFLYSISNKPFLLKLIQQLWKWTAPYRTIFYNKSKQKEQTKDLHLTIIEACEKKDSEIAVNAMLRHFEDANLELKKIIKTFNKEANL